MRNYLTIPQLEEISFLVHGFGTRSLTEEKMKSRDEWRNFHFIYLQQVHSDWVRCVEEPLSFTLKGDALITDKPDLLLIIQTADCLPVFLVDDSRKVIAAVHAGWKGTGHHIVEKTLLVLKEKYGCSLSSLWAAMGPSIGPDCYEVGGDVRRRVGDDRFFSPVNPEGKIIESKYLFDLRGANRRHMLDWGMKEDHIFSLQKCTHCCQDMHSYRREREKAGRLLNFIGLVF